MRAARNWRAACALWGRRTSGCCAREAAAREDSAHGASGNVVVLALTRGLHELWEGEIVGICGEDGLQGLAAALAEAAAQGFEGLRVYQAIFFALHFVIVSGESQDDDVGRPLDAQESACFQPGQFLNQVRAVEAVLLAVEPEPEGFIALEAESAQDCSLPFIGCAWRIGTADAGRHGKKTFEQMDSP